MQHTQPLPAGTKLSIFIHSVFDTGIIIDTFSLSNQEYRQHAKQATMLLQQRYPYAKWVQEDQTTIQGSDDASDFLPLLNLSYVTAICPTLLTQNNLHFELTSGNVCTITLSPATVYFHSFGAGIISLKALIHWHQPCTLTDLSEVNTHLLAKLALLVEERLVELISVFSQEMQASQVPLYTTPFPNLMPAAVHRDVLYWSHFVYTAQTANAANITNVAEWLAPLMMPIDQQGVSNMALKPNRYIYLGWGRSMICCSTDIDNQTLHSYVRTLEIRDYLWKTLYDLDRGLRNAILQSRSAQSQKQARKLANKLRSLDFRVKSILEELTPFKVTFDHEKIWLLQQLDNNWFTSDLIASVQSRLESFCEVYDYSEESTSQAREARLRSVLNLIGLVATTGTIVTIINYFDPFNQLPMPIRLLILAASLAVVIAIFFLAVAISRRVRPED